METLKPYWPGVPLIKLKGRSVELETRKATVLLAYLNLNLGECQRECLASLCWLEANQQKAVADLRQTLSSLSKPGRFIQEFSGRNRYLMPYRVEKTLECQAESVQDFLFETSILARLNRILCNFVTGRIDRQETK